MPPCSLNNTIIMNKLSNQADRLIKDYAFGSSLTGFIPIPLLDTMSLIGVQRLMLMRLSKLYGVPFSKNIARAGLTTLMTGIASKAASPLVGSVLKWIPGVGTLIGGMGMAATGGAATYAVGKVFQQHFEKGGTLNDFDPEQAKTALDHALEQGKQLAQKKQKAKST